jgi:N-acetylmuramoyl-L-alanine amidase
MKTLFRLVTLLALPLLISGGMLSAQQKPTIEVIYPKKNQKIAAVDSMFIFGNVTPQSQLKINGIETKVYPNGAFLAFLPVKPGAFVFRLEATLQGESGIREVPIDVPKPYEAPGKETPAIVKGYLKPSGDIGLMEGDIFTTSFRGAPGFNAYFHLSSDKGVRSMIEAEPAQQGYWAEELWGSGDYPESLAVRGVYTGAITLDKPQVSDSSRLEYYLCRKKLKKLNVRDNGFKKQLSDCGCVSRENDARISVMSAGKIVIGELIDSVQTIRTGPRKGYLSIYQPRGVRFRITGSYRNHYRAQLIPGLEAWLPDSSLKRLPQGTPLPTGEVSLVRTEKLDQGVKVSFDVGDRLPFRVEEDLALNKLYLDIYNCNSSIDFLRYDTRDSIIGFLNWSQPQTGMLRLTLDLRQTIWGYDCCYEGTRLNLRLRGRPTLDDRLKNVRIMIDPGHAADPGAIGPTSVMEKDVNLAIALQLAQALRDRRATVAMTRDSDTNVPLYDRPKLAYRFNPDIYIAVHNNAVPDGVNPFFNNGSSTYYYEPHSFELAKAVQKRLVAATGLPDIGLYSGNFAVVRPTGYLAILVECAFMMIPEQEAALQEPSFQKKIAEAIVAGVIDYCDVESEKADCGQ